MDLKHVTLIFTFASDIDINGNEVSQPLRQKLDVDGGVLHSLVNLNVVGVSTFQSNVSW